MKLLSTSIGHNAGIAAFGLLVNGPIMFITSVILARFLGADALGIYTLSITIGTLAGCVGSFGMQAGVFKYVAHYLAQDEPTKAWSVFHYLSIIAAILSILSGIFLLLQSQNIAFLLKKPEVTPGLWVMAAYVPAIGLQTVWLYALRSLQDIKNQTLIEKIIQPIIRLLLFTFILWLGWSVIGILVAHVFVTIIGTIWTYLVTIQRIPSHNTRKAISFSEVNEWISYSLPVFLENLLRFFLFQTGIEVLLLGYFLSNSDVGIYSAPYRLIPLMMVPAIAFSTAFGPTVPKDLARNDIESVRTNFKSVTFWITILTMPLFLGLTLIGDRLLALFGDEFVKGWPALIILAIGFLIDATTGEIRTILLVSGKSKLFLIDSIILIGLNLAIGIFLIPRYGLIGAAISGAASRIFYNIVSLIQVHHYMKIHPFHRDYFKPWLSALFTVIIFLVSLHIFNLMPMQKFFLIFVQGIFIVSLYILFLLILRIRHSGVA